MSKYAIIITKGGNDMYCSQCGRELADGEVCSCKKNQRKNSGILYTIKRTFRLVMLLYTKPAKAMEEYVGSNGAILSCVLIGIKAIAYGLLGYLLCFGANGKITASEQSIMLVKLPMISTAILFAVLALVGDVLLAAVLYFSTEILTKKNVPFTVAIQLVGMSVTGQLAGLVLALLFSISIRSLVSLALIFSTLSGLIFLTCAALSYKRITSDEAIRTVTICMTILLVLTFILANTMWGTISRIMSALLFS
jgi:hypothetical protein